MKAMVLAAGLGTRLRPLTFEIPKPMVPVVDRPLMAHVVDHCRRQGFDQLIANLHHLPDTIRSYFGAALDYRHEEELLGTAGGVRRARDFFGGDTIVVVPGGTLTDIDLTKLVARHRAAGGIATVAAKAVDDTRGHRVVLQAVDGRVSGFQVQPHPDEALSTLADCGIYCFEPEIFDYFPATAVGDWTRDVFPVLLEHDVPFYLHQIEDYWRDIRSPDDLRAGTFDVLAGRVATEVPEGSPLPADCQAEGQVWIGRNCAIGSGVRLIGPVVVGDGSRIGDGVALRDSIVFPGTSLGHGQMVIGSIYGHSGALRRD